jgi:uncharacterized membrane protein
MCSVAEMTDKSDLNCEKQQKLNRQISAVLRAGVIASFVIILAGLVSLALLHSQSPMAVVPLPSLPAELARLNPLAMITAGILLVLVLPVVVIIMAFIYYINIRDRRMIIVCSILLAMLIFSFIYTLK